MKSVPKLVLGSLIGTSVLAQNFGLGSSGPTSRHYQDSLPKCGKPRYHHNVNLFFELPDERKRRSADAVSEMSPAESVSPVRHNGNLNWLESSKKEAKKEERKRLRKEKKGKTGSSHLDSQRLIGGQTAIPHSWPWQVFVKIEGKAGGYDCGGSIIGDRWIITAAHCVPYRPVPSMSYVYAGIHKIHTGQKQKLKVKRVIVHQQYGFPILDNNDIALVELEKPLKFTSAIQPICLPDPSICLPHGMKCAATGWGVTDKFGTQIPDQLNEVAVRIIERDQCENIHSDYNGQLSDQMLCAGYKEGGRDACLGDSGGPLACQAVEDGPWLLYGITSWGIGCGDPLHPGVYTRVTELIQWIQDNTGIGPAISSGDFPQYKCAGAQLTNPLIQKPETKPDVSLPAQAPEKKPEAAKVAQEESEKPSGKPNKVAAKPTQVGEFDLQAKIDADLEEVTTCGGSTDLAAGSLRSPGYGKKYPVGIKCFWQIKPDIPDDQWIEIEFKKNDFGKCTDKGFAYNEKPKNDYVAILDDFGRVIKRSICRASNNAPLYLYSPKSASVLMSSDSNPSDNGKGFRMRFKTLNYIPSQCGDQKFHKLQSDETVHISSMNWPNRYLSGVSCNWNVEAPLGHILLIEVDQMDIGGMKNGKCVSSHAKITEGESDELGTFCGKMSKKTMVTKTMKSDGNSININFEAGNTVPKRGFRFKIKAIPKDSQKSQRAFGGNSGNEKFTSEDQSTPTIISRIEKLLEILKRRYKTSQA